MKKLLLHSCLVFFIFIISLPKYLLAQNIGIGTTTPSEKLHVAGNIKEDTLKPTAIKLPLNAGAGKILTSDAAGNSSWRTNNIAAGGNVGFGVWGNCAANANISEYNPVIGGANDGFASAVSISGNYAIVGANKDDIGVNTDQGSASIYQYNGSNWVLMQKITDATGAANDQFGTSVFISGNVAIIGANFDDVGANADQGSVSIYQNNGGTWVLAKKITDATGEANDQFGVSVSLSGNYAIIGAYLDDGAAGADQGSASIYQYNGSTWVLMQKILDATGAASDQFGISVSISGNFAIAGADFDDGAASNQGSASIFQYNGSSWVLLQKIIDANGGLGYKFGHSVSLSGNYALVGSPTSFFFESSVSFYQYSGTAWLLMQRTKNNTGYGSTSFGTSVSISGDYAIVGDGFDNIGVNSAQGSATIYKRLGLGWGKLQYVTDPVGTQTEWFGLQAAIDGNNKRFLLSALRYTFFPATGKAVFGKIN
ncbi:MAG: hypothetical protein ABIN67_06850 [Ferruginibacter sp.]